MTDTTDIKALREAMLTKGKSSLTAKEVVTIISELDRLNDSVKHLRIEASASDAAFLEMKKQYSTQFDRCRELSERLESERQRAADLSLKNADLHYDCTVYRGEIAELKGDQVPVAQIVISKNWPDTGRKVIDYYLEKIQHLPAGTELFTAPQKPVVPVGFLFVVKATGAVIYSIADAAIDGARLIGQIYGDTAIEAAGGIVKDGE